MTIKNSITHFRNTALVLGLLAAVPMAAQAMVMEHEVSNIEVFTSSNVVKQLPADADHALAARLGTYAGTTGIGIDRVSVNPSVGATLAQEDRLYRWLPEDRG